MKKKLLTMLMVLPLLAQAQFSENFDAAAVKPAGWTVINGGDANGFIFGAGAPGSALSQPNAAQINYKADAHDDYLITPAITVTAGVNDRLTYFVKSQDPSYLEAYEVKLSTTTATADAFNTVLTQNADAPPAWTQFSIDLSEYEGKTIYVGFHATSADRFRLLFDNVVNDTAPTVAPDCPTALVAPAQGATGVDYAATTFSWTPPTTGGPVDYYELYLDTNPNPTTKVGVFVNPTATIQINSDTQYYWKVVSKNAAGESTSCLTSSFKTKVDPILPYCGPLVYGNGVEPITSVNFGGMTNTSSATVNNPHEIFVDKIAEVKQGESLSIELKGNTGGNFTSRFIVFVDWNQDGQFSGAGESYFVSAPLSITNSTGTDTKTAVGTIVVPQNAKLGNTRMRIKKNFGATAAPNPCSSGGTLTAPADSGYGQAEDYTVNVSAVLGTSDLKKTQISVYPNPVKDVLNVSTADKKVMAVEFYSADGKLVKTAKDAAAVNTSDLQKGVYIVKVKTSDSEKSFKVIKE